MVAVPRTVPETTIHAEWWDEGEAVVIRTFAGSFDRKRIAAAGYKVQASAATPDQAGVELQMHEADLEKKAIGIVSWTLTFADGSPMPCDRAHMRLLPERDSDFILSELTKHWDAWGTVGGDADARTFPENGAGSVGGATAAKRGRG